MMQTLRHAFNWAIVALASILFGLLLLGSGIAQAGSGSFFQLVGMFLILYGVILAWWRVEAAAPILQAQVARIAHRVREQAVR